MKKIELWEVLVLLIPFIFYFVLHAISPSYKPTLIYAIAMFLVFSFQIIGYRNL